MINGHTDTIKCLFNAELSGTAINELNNERTADGRSLMDLAPNLATREVLVRVSVRVRVRVMVRDRVRVTVTSTWLGLGLGMLGSDSGIG